MTHYENKSSKELSAGIGVPEDIVQGIAAIVSEAKRQTVVHVNSTLNMMYWQVGKYLVDELHYETYGQYGKGILQGIAARLTDMFGRGFNYTALTRMMKVASTYPSQQMFATLSQTLTWSHLIELVTIDNQANVLKLGKFKPEYKGQMELYLKYLKKHEQKPHEQSPIGLLLCSEGNTEHVELMMLGEENIKVAQYLTELPDKQWFIDKLNRAILIAQENRANKQIKQ